MTVLITGSSGFIGSNLVQKLNKLNKVFYTIDKVKNPYLKTKNFFKINLCDEKKLEKVFKENKINYIIHLAALPGFVSCHNSPSDAFDNNVRATVNVLNLSLKYNIKKILIASSMGVDNFKNNPSIYGLTKVVCEMYGMTYSKVKKMNIVNCKLSNVFGQFSNHKNSVVHSFIKKIISNKSIEIHSNGRQKRDFIYVKDVCDTLLKELYSKSNRSELRINTSKFLSILDLKNCLDNISNKNNKFRYIKTPDGYDDNVYKNPSIKIPKKLMKNLELTYNWYKSF
jgi:UDP-glucose 4-epimerase